MEKRRALAAGKMIAYFRGMQNGSSKSAIDAGLFRLPILPIIPLKTTKLHNIRS